MSRLTYFNKSTNLYELIDSKADWLQALGKLEDYKEHQEPKTLGQYLVTLRRRLGFTQEEFSKKTSIARSTLAKYESDKVRPKKSFLHSVIRHCDVSAEELQMAYRKYICGFDDDEFNRLLDTKPLNQLGPNIGQLIKCEREFKGWTKGELAHQTSNISTQTITKIESGEMLLNPFVYKVLAITLQSKRLYHVAERIATK